MFNYATFESILERHTKMNLEDIRVALFCAPWGWDENTERASINSGVSRFISKKGKNAFANLLPKATRYYWLTYDNNTYQTHFQYFLDTSIKKGFSGINNNIFDKIKGELCSELDIDKDTPDEQDGFWDICLVYIGETRVSYQQEKEEVLKRKDNSINFIFDVFRFTTRWTNATNAYKREKNKCKDDKIEKKVSSYASSLAKAISERCSPFIEDVKALIENDSSIRFDNVDCLVLAQREFEKSIEEKTKKIINEIKALADEKYSQNLGEQGIVIEGKSFNVAFSTYALQALMNCPSVYHVARLSAYHFSYDFRNILTHEGSHIIPPDECDFMDVCASFDKKCGWYDADETVRFKLDSKKFIIKTRVKRAFVSTPDVYFYTEGFGKTEHLSGYYLSLFNACADYIAFMSYAKGKEFPRKFVWLCQNTDNANNHDKDFSRYQLHYISDYLEEWFEIDKMMCSIVQKLSNRNLEGEISGLLDEINHMKNIIIECFGADITNLPVSVLGNEKIGDILLKIRRAPDLKENHYVLRCLLNEIRVMYEDLRIKQFDNGKNDTNNIDNGGSKC